MEPVYVPKNPHEKAMQRALIQYRDPKNYELVKEALEKSGRKDLIGFGPKCLIRPRDGQGQAERKNQKTPSGKKGASQKNLSGKKKTIRNVHRKK